MDLEISFWLNIGDVMFQITGMQIEGILDYKVCAVYNVVRDSMHLRTIKLPSVCVVDDSD